MRLVQCIYTHIHGHCAMMQIPGSEKFPQTRFECFLIASKGKASTVQPSFLFQGFFSSIVTGNSGALPQGSRTPLSPRALICSSPDSDRLPFAADSGQNCLCHSQGRGARPFPPLLLAPVRLFSSDSHSLASYQLPIM